jgi:hypothetical protein
MGEYAKNERGESVKIGTCEDMYYLRFDQRTKVQWERGNVDPVKDAPALRFRFPWPDEDHVAPGDFHANGYERAVPVHGFTTVADFDHHSVQFTAKGYNVCLPCPESGPPPAGLVIHRNGFAGAVQLVQQRYRPGIGLVPVLRCGGCGAKYRLEERHEIEALAVAFRNEGDVKSPAISSEWWHAIADRILAGIAEEVTP